MSEAKSHETLVGEQFGSRAAAYLTSAVHARGAGVAVPSGAKTVDAAGANVYPGFVDAATDIGLNEPGPRNYDDVREFTDWNQALRTRTAFQIDSDAVPVTPAP